MSLGDLLRHIRMRHGLNQSEMGDLFFRNKDYVYKIESDKMTPTFEELKIIGEKLNEPIITLVMYGLSIKQIL